MIFSNALQKSTNISSEVSFTDDWQTLAEWLGITTDELQIKGEKALKETTVYTCIKIRAEMLGKLPLKIYQNSDGVIRKASDHYLYPLLKLRPNPYMSATDFWKCLSVQRDIHGNSFAWLEIASDGKITGIYPLDSSRVKIYVDNVGLLNSKNSVWYVYTDLIGNQYKIVADEMWHFKGLSTNGIVGMNPIEVLRGTIENAKASSTFLNNSYKGGMSAAGIVNYTGDLSPAAEKNFIDKFEQMVSGLKNANKIAMLPPGYTYQNTALKLTDAQFLENTRLTLQQLTAAFGIKPHQVNDQTKTSYASTAEANREFYTDTGLEILTTFEQEIDYKAFLDSEISKGFYAKFDVDVVLRADLKTRYEAYGVAVQNGFKKPNEIRALEEDPWADGGDDLLCNGNMIKIKDIGKNGGKGK